jgi:hypothetical protein
MGVHILTGFYLQVPRLFWTASITLIIVNQGLPFSLDLTYGIGLDRRK